MTRGKSRPRSRDRLLSSTAPSPGTCWWSRHVHWKSWRLSCLPLEEDPRVEAAYPDLFFAPSDGEEEAPPPVETLQLSYARQISYRHAGMFEAWNIMNDQIGLLNPVTIVMIDKGFVSQTGIAEVDATIMREFDMGRIQVRQGMGIGNHGKWCSRRNGGAQQRSI